MPFNFSSFRLETEPYTTRMTTKIIGQQVRVTDYRSQNFVSAETRIRNDKNILDRSFMGSLKCWSRGSGDITVDNDLSVTVRRKDLDHQKRWNTSNSKFLAPWELAFDFWTLIIALEGRNMKLTSVQRRCRCFCRSDYWCH